MKRIRILFAIVAISLAVPLAWLVRRTFLSLDEEDARRHAALAEQVFAEMERALTDFLQREDARPFEEYRYLFAASKQRLAKGTALTISALAPLPDTPMIVGYFQIEPDDTFGTPHVPNRVERQELPGGWAASSEVAARVFELRAATARLWPATKVDQPLAGTVPLPGTTVTLRSTASPSRAPIDGLRGRIDIGGMSTALKTRGRRASKVTSVSSYNVESTAVQTKQTRQEQLAAQLHEVEVSVEPMVGRLIGVDYLAVYRTVWSDGRAYRQGLIARVDALAEWLRNVAFPNGGSDEVGLAVRPMSAQTRFDTPHLFQHRFGEPFGALQATLGLPQLQEDVASDLVRIFALVVVLAGVLGLGAIYRAVAVAVRFAERRSNFVSAVTHELKTPLTVIRMDAEMLQEGMLISEAKRDEYYRNIAKESDRLGRLINNVLELSRIERGERRVHLATGSLEPTVREVVSMLEPHAAERGFRLELDCAPDLPPAVFNRDGLSQIVFNLIDNALKYAEGAARKTIRIRCSKHEDRVVLSVRDHGPGVAAAHLRHIFEPFYRGQDELTRTTKGTGIGLSLVKGLAERMGGRVFGGNAGDGGFEVRVILPAATCVNRG